MNARILVVDDDHDNAKSLSLLLSMDGHSVQFITDTQQVLPGVQAFKPQVLIMDTAMSGQNGNELTRQIRSYAHSDHLRIVIISGYCRESNRQEALAAGADEFYAKPIRLEQLRYAVRRLEAPAACSIGSTSAQPSYSSSNNSRAGNGSNSYSMSTSPHWLTM
jgi:CheY-like chemotaxis protein